MKSVYEASTGLDAHMILNLLEMRGISGRIEGEYLQGGIGELQAIGLVRVMVEEQDYDEARKIIAEWESMQPAAEDNKPDVLSAGNIGSFAFGIIVGAALMYWLLKMSSTGP
jgi:Putative prokaryotic signal transducing protein